MIYLDNNATTRVAPEVLDAMQPYLSQFFGNPSSAHALGREMKRAVDQSREQVASLIGAADTSEIVFTSCGSESDNWAIRGVLATCRGPHIRASDLPEDVRRRVVQAGRTELERLELEAIRTVLREHAGNKRQAARALGISRSTLYRKLEAFAPELG